MVLQVEVQNASSVVEVFDAIGYLKGSSLVRIIKEYLGHDVFQVVEPNYHVCFRGFASSFICF